jgi:hypothetical protein
VNRAAEQIGVGFVGLGATRGWARRAHLSALGMLDSFAIRGTTTAPRLADAVALHRTLDSIRAGAH